MNPRRIRENEGEESDVHVDGDVNLGGRGGPRDQNKKKRLSEVVASLDEKYSHLQQEIHQKKKGKTSLVDNLLHGTASPFTD